MRRLLHHPRRLPVLALAALALWLAAMVLAPLSLAPGTVAGLDGRENHVDHYDVWATLPFPQAVTYAVGDLLCHQKAWRTFELHGNQMPVDERMTAIFFAAAPAMLLTLRAPVTPYVTRSLDALVGLREREPRAAARWWTWAVVLALLPAAVDVAWENLLGRESTALLRVVTGALAGVAGGLVLGAFLASLDHVARTRWLRPRRAAT